MALFYMFPAASPTASRFAPPVDIPSITDSAGVTYLATNRPSSPPPPYSPTRSDAISISRVPFSGGDSVRQRVKKWIAATFPTDDEHNGTSSDTEDLSTTETEELKTDKDEEKEEEKDETGPLVLVPPGLVTTPTVRRGVVTAFRRGRVIGVGGEDAGSCLLRIQLEQDQRERDTALERSFFRRRTEARLERRRVVRRARSASPVSRTESM